MRALDTAATGMAAQDLKVQVIAGNIANMGTTGFKSQRAEFQDLIYEHVQRIGAQASENGNILPVGIEIGSGVKTVGTPRLMTQGSFAQTGNTLDVAIQGSGWFKILSMAAQLVSNDAMAAVPSSDRANLLRVVDFNIHFTHVRV